jgi:osmotically-inducible protein OsmY
VENGAASLYGTVRSGAEKIAAEEATRRVGAVVTSVQSLQVVMPSDCERSDAALAASVRRALRWNLLVPTSVSAKVAGGIVTLEGRVRWSFQRRAAARAVRRMKDVAWVYDAVLLAPQTKASTVHDAVKAALARRGTADANSIHVASEGGKVTLSGYARSPESVANAEFAAWGVPGVTEVVEDVHSSGDRLTQEANAIEHRVGTVTAPAAERPTPATGNESLVEGRGAAIARKDDVHRR